MSETYSKLITFIGFTLLYRKIVHLLCTAKASKIAQNNNYKCAWQLILQESGIQIKFMCTIKRYYENNCKNESLADLFIK